MTVSGGHREEVMDRTEDFVLAPCIQVSASQIQTVVVSDLTVGLRGCMRHHLDPVCHPKEGDGHLSALRTRMQIFAPFYPRESLILPLRWGS